MEKIYNIILKPSSHIGKFPLFSAMQGDKNTRIIHAKLLNDDGTTLEIESDVIAEYWSKKPDGTGTSKTADRTDNIVTVTLTEQDTAVPGTIDAAIVLKRAIDEEILTMRPFQYQVDEFPLGADVESTSEYLSLIDATEAAEEAAAAANAIADTVDGAVTRANNAADRAHDSETEAGNSATLSESWAIGGTATRSGEDADNASYYAQQSDNKATLAQSWAIGGTDTREDEDTDNSRYYSQQASGSADSAAGSATSAQSWAVGGTDTREDEDIDNASYYASQAEGYLNDISGLVGDLATETTQEQIKDATDTALGYLEQLVEQGADADTLNGYSLSHGEGGEVVLSYTYEDDGEEVTESVVAVTQDTAQAIADKLAQLAELWEGMIENE